MNNMNETAKECIPHPNNWRNVFLQRKKSFREKFFEKINKNGPIQPHVPHLGNCHVWMGGKCGSGYGQLGRSGKMAKAHKVAWEFQNGEIKDGLHVLHKCDNKSCVRPDHLFLGTAKDNARDMVAKKRNRHPTKTKLNEHQVKEILKLRDGRSITLEKASIIFGVSIATIHSIEKRQTWKNISLV